MSDTLPGLKTPRVPRDPVARALAAGVHPASRIRLSDERGATCGGCVLALQYRDTSGDARWKCALTIVDDDLHGGRRLVLSWPACSGRIPLPEVKPGHRPMLAIVPSSAYTLDLRPECECGWKGEATPGRAAAFAEHSAHVLEGP